MNTLRPVTQLRTSDMAKNTADYDTTIDELADSVVRELADRMSRKPPDVDSARVEVSRLLRDALPALWEWSSQECEIDRCRAARDEAVAHAQSVNADMDKAEEVLLATGHDGMSLAEIAENVAAELAELRAGKTGER